MASFNTKFKELRVISGFTQKEIAQKLDCSQSTITMWETGKRQPDIETLERIADLFNVDMNFLIGTSNNTTKILNENQHRFLSIFDKLTPEGQERLLEYAQALLALGKYDK